MSTVFLKVLNMSIAASWLVLAALCARLLLRRAPGWVACLLWAMVAVRLVCPFSFESAFSLIPGSETVPQNIAVSAVPSIDSGVRAVNRAVNPVILHFFAPDAAAGEYPLRRLIPAVAAVWLAGTAVTLLYGFVGYMKLRKAVSASIPAGEHVMVCDEIAAPFILGVLKPMIYVPSSICGQTLECVIRHENAHLKHRDQIWKPLGFLLLSVYWFNPLCWLAFILLCRDIETACDERVIRDMDKDAKAAYSQAILECSFPGKTFAAYPLAFGEAGVKGRVKNVLAYKKPSFWTILIAVIVCIISAACLLTDPFSAKSLSGKLGVSMDMAVSEANRSSRSDGHFMAVDYDVLRIEKKKNKTTVYAWVFCEEYSFDGVDITVESGSHIPTAVTFDTSDEGSDSSAYDVIEYWQPRDGSYYAQDIRDRFPAALWLKALDPSGAARQKENCMQAAREYYGEGMG